MAKKKSAGQFQTTSDREFLKELKDSISNIDGFLQEIVNNKTVERIKPLSVELRKLLNPGGKGNAVLQRAQNRFGVKFVFPDGSKTLPRTPIKAGLNDYINRMIFAIGGRPVTRISLVKLVADERGAHIDDQADILHRQSQGVMLPLGNPARDKLFFEPNHRYLIVIAKTVSSVVKNQLLNSVSF